MKKENAMTRRVLVRSSLPVFAAAAAFALYAVFLPIYRLVDVVLAAAVAALAFIVVGVFVPFRIYLDPAREAAILNETGDDAADAILLALQGYLAEFREKEAAQHPLSVWIGKLRGLTEQMHAQILARPEQARKLRKVVEYYLPTVQKLLAAHGEVDKQTGRIEHVLESVADAFRKLLADMDANRALDVETDIIVLRQVLAREGFAAQNDVVHNMDENGDANA